MTTSKSTISVKEKAENVLRAISQRKSLDRASQDHGDSVKDLNSALNILSEQLYQKKPHFILETIQNADDNTFEDGVVPTITFDIGHSATAWQMLIDCNEAGFKKENVEALCRIGRSTKTVEDRLHSYIGEQGNGFESVFRIANVVHVSSNVCSFKFDRQSMLGMLTPIIETLPLANLIPGLDYRVQRDHTQVLLELFGQYEFENITAELKKLKPEILIFLRKIRKLVIHTPDENLQFERQSVIEDHEFDGGETETLVKTNLSNKETIEEKYMIVRQSKDYCVKDKQRQEMTEVVLAFPVDNWRPLLRAQDTFAFLPINVYGSNYLIQADFLLIRSRESIKITAWNEDVLAHVLRAFVWEAVPRFNRVNDRTLKEQNLRYAWPMFLKDGGRSCAFWSNLKKRILRMLAEENVLESRQGKLTQPRLLYYIPPEFRLNGRPLVEDEESEQHHLSFLYDSEIANTRPELEQMGVKVLDFAHFFRALKDIIRKTDDSFLAVQSQEWHSKISRLFLLEKCRTQLMDLPVIPLNDGRWGYPSQGHFFVEGESIVAEVPTWLYIYLVDREACQDTERMKFFKWLGIKSCDQVEVCRMIMQSYNPFRPRSPAQLIQDLMFLFQTPRTIYKEPLEELQLLCAGKHDSRFMYAKTMRASRMYIDYPDRKSVISKYAEHPESPMPTLNSRYFEAVRRRGKSTEFVSWAVSELKMSLLPRIVDDQQLPSTEFHFLKAHAMEDLLLLIRDNWEHYAGNFKTGKFKEAVSRMKVRCINGLHWRLDQTVLPHEALQRAGPDLNFIDIPEPYDSRWLKFSIFGVLNNTSTSFQLRELKALATRRATDSSSISTVKAIYTRLGCSRDQEAIRQAFAQLPLVYLFHTNKWVYLSECVWNAPQQLNCIYRLSSLCPTYSSLFRDCLVLRDASLTDVIKELQSVTDVTPFHTLQQLLLLLNESLTPIDLPGCLSVLKGKKIIPVTTSSGEGRMDYDGQGWYFADRQSLWERFHGKVPLIAFDVKTVRELTPLIKAMNLSGCLLSAAVKSECKISGVKILDKERTGDLRNRAQYFVKLLPIETKERKSWLLTHLLDLKVWGVEAMKLTQEVRNVKHIEDTNRILFNDNEDGKIEIYFSMKDERSAIINFEISKEFIRYCGITDHSFQKLVLPIIQYPHDEIERLLEDYGFDESNNDDQKSTEILECVSAESNDNSGLIAQVIDTHTSLPTTPTSSIFDGTFDSPASEPSPPSKIIPDLDESIASVRKTAALQSVTPSRIRGNGWAPVDKIFLGHEYGSSSIPWIMPVAARHKSVEATHSKSFVMECDAKAFADAFEFVNFHADFSKAFGVDLPIRKRHTSSNRKYFTSRYSRSPRAARIVSRPESTMLKL